MPQIKTVSADTASRDVEDRAPGVLSNALLALVFVCVTALSVAACGGGGGGGGSSTGGGGGGGGVDYDDDDDDDEPVVVQANLASIQENIFTPICTQCHTGAAAPQGLRLEAGMSYGMLVNVASVEVPSLMRVEPGNPDDSYIIHKLEGTATVGERMPLGGPYLSQENINAIRQWITDGAMDTAVAGGTSSKTTLAAGWPVDGSTLDSAPDRIVLIADGELDASMLHASTVQVIHVTPGGDRRALDNVHLELTSLAPTVVTLDTSNSEWAAGEYEVRVTGSGSMAVADRAGRLIDGDHDGVPGGDFVALFKVREK